MGELDFTYDDSLLQGDEEEDPAVLATQETEHKDQEVLAVWAALLGPHFMSILIQFQTAQLEVVQKERPLIQSLHKAQPVVGLPVHVSVCMYECEPPAWAEPVKVDNGPHVR